MVLVFLAVRTLQTVTESNQKCVDRRVSQQIGYIIMIAVSSSTGYHGVDGASYCRNLLQSIPVRKNIVADQFVNDYQIIPTEWSLFLKCSITFALCVAD